MVQQIHKATSERQPDSKVSKEHPIGWHGYPTCNAEIDIGGIVVFRCTEALGHSGQHIVSGKGDAIKGEKEVKAQFEIMWMED